jgi:type IV pilus assembly protein PilM
MNRSRRSDHAVSIVNPDGHVIGLDIGATAVRAAILAPDRGESDGLMTVEDLGQAPLPPGVVVDGVLQDAPTLTRVLTQLWREHDFGCSHVIIGVSNPQVVVRPMQMPNLPPEQLARALPFRAREVIALELDKAVLDFRPLGPSPDDPNLIDGLLVAAPRAPVLAAVRAVEAAGLRIVRVDLASFAALRSTAADHGVAEAVVDIGAQMTNIVIHNLGVPRVVRALNRGGEQLTERLVERTGASAAEAEILKRESGVHESENETSMILSTTIRPLVSDIRSSIQYFTTTNPDAPLERVSLTGGGAELPGLAEMLTEDVGLPCTLVSPLRNVLSRIASPEGRHEAPATATAVSVGLAMGAAA